MRTKKNKFIKMIVTQYENGYQISELDKLIIKSDINKLDIQTLFSLAYFKIVELDLIEKAILATGNAEEIARFKKHYTDKQK